jgi:predicted outer membrane protein
VTRDGAMVLLRAALIALAIVLLATASHAADPYACFGSMRYLAQRAGYSCEDLESFCAVARAIYREAGNDEAAAGRLAQARGHSPTVQRLARRMCKP